MSDTHTIHPSINEHGLADNCPRCAEHAEQPWFSLDNANLEALIRRTQAWRRDSSQSPPRSQTELTAMLKIEQHLRILERMERYLPTSR